MTTTYPSQRSRGRGRLLTSGQVALVFGVDPRTVRTWDRRFTVTRTLGGHRRYRESEVRALAAQQTIGATEAAA